MNINQRLSLRRRDLSFLPKRAWRWSRMIPGLRHRGGVEDPAIDQHITNRRAVPDVHQRIPVEHEEIGKLSVRDGTEVTVEAEVLGAVNRRGLERFVIAQPTLLQHPQ